MKRNLKRISLLLAVVLLVGCMAALSACTASSGTALKFVSATVNRSSVRTDYYVGEEVDFSGIRLRVRYNDALQSVNADLSMLKFELDGEDITEDLSVLTAEAGEKELSILYFDGLVDNEWKRATLTVRVTEAPVVVYDGVVSSFSAPAARRAFEAAAQEGDGQYVGAQNPFFFLPEYTVEDPENGEEIAGAVLPLEIGLALASEEDGEPAALERREAGKNAVAFYDGETLIAEADIRSGRFSFTEEAIGLALDLSVAPPAAYAYEGEPLTALLLIVDAYNVYDARELCLLDNANGRNHLNAAVGYADWQVFKETYGYADISVNGVVLQQDLTLRATDLPANFFVSSNAPITVSAGENEATLPAGSKFLADGTEIYVRVTGEDEIFPVMGNFFTVDASDLPIVATEGMKPSLAQNNRAAACGAEGASAALFRLIGEEAEPGSLTESAGFVYAENVGFIGNVDEDGWADAEGNPIALGGLHLLAAGENAVLADGLVSRGFADSEPEE